MTHTDLLKLLFELGVLSRTPRTGPYHVGITNQETIAAHAYRASVLAYFIAKEEGADAQKVMTMALVHDMTETRSLEQTFIQQKYASVDALRMLSDQLRNLRGGDELQRAFDELSKGATKESHVVHDAALLETLIEAKEYVQAGVTIMERWFLDKRAALKTATGKALFDLLEKETIYWWND